MIFGVTDDLFVALLSPHLVVILYTSRFVWFRLLTNNSKSMSES